MADPALQKELDIRRLHRPHGRPMRYEEEARGQLRTVQPSSEGSVRPRPALFLVGSRSNNVKQG